MNAHELCFNAQSDWLEVTAEAIYLVLLMKLQWKDEDEFNVADISKGWTEDTKFSNHPSATMEINDEKALSDALPESDNSRDLLKRCVKRFTENYSERKTSPDYLLFIVVHLFLGKICFG